jgi:hypothetical protein
MSPLMESSLRPITSSFRASSLVDPREKMCPNCESAYSCRPPLAPTEKYPHTLGVDRKVSSLIPPLVGLNPSSGFSPVIRAAITWAFGGNLEAY